MKVFPLACVLVLSASSLSGQTAFFGSPAFDSATGTGYKVSSSPIIWLVGTTLAEDGTSIANMNYFESNAYVHAAPSLWRGTQITLFPVVENQYGNLQAVNNSHESIGILTTITGPDTERAASRWSPLGESTLLSIPPDYPSNVEAYDINDSGIIVGSSGQVIDGIVRNRRASKWESNGTVVQYSIPDTFGMHVTSYAGSINTAGQVGGSISVRDENYQFQYSVPVRWESDNTATLLDMVTTAGTEVTSAFVAAINKSGETAGYGHTPENNIDDNAALFWNVDGTATRLANHPLAEETREVKIYDMNDRGDVIGHQEIRIGTAWSYRAIVWSKDGTAHPVDRHPSASSSNSAFPMQINNSGYGVGSTNNSYTSQPGGLAAMWSPEGEFILLNSFRPSGNEWNLTLATAISNTGWVHGIGTFDPSGPASSYARDWSILLPFAGTYGLGDANFDESIDFNDLLIVAQNYESNTNGSVDVGDFNLDGVVDFNDLLVIAQNYGSDPTSLTINSSLNFESDWALAQSMVPEPGLLSIMGIGMLILRRAR